MTPQQRADAVRASVVHGLDELEPVFRDRVDRRARQLAQSLDGMVDRSLRFRASLPTTSAANFLPTTPALEHSQLLIGVSDVQGSDADD